MSAFLNYGIKPNNLKRIKNKIFTRVLVKGFLAMQVCVIKNTEPKRASLPLTGAFCGLVGYTLKHNLPIEMDEVDAFYPNKSATLVDRNIKVVKQECLENIAAIARNDKNSAADLFIRKVNAEEAVRMSPSQEAMAAAKQNLRNIKNEIKNAAPEIKTSISHYAGQIAERVKSAKTISTTVLGDAIKANRSTSLYVLPGVVLGIAGAFVYNVIGAIRE